MRGPLAWVERRPSQRALVLLGLVLATLSVWTALDGPVVVDAGDALPVCLSPLGERAAVGNVRFSALTLGYRPPPLLESGPSRAPPVG